MVGTPHGGGGMVGWYTPWGGGGWLVGTPLIFTHEEVVVVVAYMRLPR